MDAASTTRMKVRDFGPIVNARCQAFLAVRTSFSAALLFPCEYGKSCIFDNVVLVTKIRENCSC